MTSSAWTSNLSVSEFAAVRSVGFEPVGQVMGTTVTQLGYSGPGYCTQMSGYRYGRLPQVAGTGSTRNSSWVGFGSRVKALYDARHRVVDRLTSECLALGGDGIVGVHLSMRRFPSAGESIELQAIGTAVRSSGVRHLDKPFVSDVSGQDFAKLMLAGWAPCGLVFGVAIGVRHDDYRTQRAMTAWKNVEVPGYTELVQQTRGQVREEIKEDVRRHGGDGLVVRGMRLSIREQECTGSRDHIAEATLVGTALTRFRRSDQPREARPLMMMKLGERHSRVLQHTREETGRA